MKRINLRPYFIRLKKKFRLTIFNESTLENFFSLRASLMDGLFMVASAFILFFIFSWFLLVHTPLRVFLPQDLDPGMRKTLVQQAIRVDSLANALDQQADYLIVVKAIMAGELPLDSIRADKGKILMDSAARTKLKLLTASKREINFREDFEETEKYNLSILSSEKEKKEILFHPPLKGRIVSHFNPKLKQHGIRIEVSGIQSSLSVLAGTVVFAGYTSDYEYVIQIQHANDVVSVYKFNTELLKKQGDKVRAGESIGIVGSNPARNGVAYLEFELWQRGIPLNPEEYIVF
jgi:murein DD-endopeptidase MepM/ murein hydrolase activator NlpD